MTASLRSIALSSLVVLFSGLACLFSAGDASVPNPPAAARKVHFAAAKSSLITAYARQPIAFEPNEGESDPQVKFLWHRGGRSLYLTPDAAVLTMVGGGVPSYRQVPTLPVSHKLGMQTALAAQAPQLRGRSLGIEFAGANHDARLEGSGRQPAETNYFVGNDRSKWHRHVPAFARVKYHSIYPGIDLVFRGNPDQLEHDFMVAPNANPRAIHLAIKGADQFALKPSGDLLITAGPERITLRKPDIYQVIGRRRVGVKGGFVREGGDLVGFQIASYDHSQPLVIDPSLVWSTYVGGNFEDIPYAIAADSNSNPYVSGFTCSANFPKTVAKGTDLACDAFVVKLASATGTLVYSSIIGGSGFDNALGIAVDGSGAAYIAGQTYSADFPDAAQALNALFDAFVAKLDPDGNLLWAQLIGGSTPTNAPPTGTVESVGWSEALGIAIPQGCAKNCATYITGQTSTTDFPTTSNALQTAWPGDYFDAFLSLVSSDGTQLTYSSYYAGNSGGNSNGSTTIGNAITVDGSGDAYVGGIANDGTLPVTSGNASYNRASDGWVAKFDPTQSGTSSLIYSTYLGGSGLDSVRGIALASGCESDCIAYVAGDTYSSDFPTTSDAYQTASGGSDDAFISELGTSGNILYSTYLGGPGGNNAESISVDASGNAWITGVVSDTEYPVVNALQGSAPPHGELLVSTDGGVTFSPTGMPLSAGAPLPNAAAVDPNTNDVYVGTFNNGLWGSTDGGTTFNQIALAGVSVTAVAIDPSTNPSTVYAGTGFGIYASSNGYSAEFGPTAITALAVNNTNHEIYAGTGTFSAVIPGSKGAVYQGTNGGAFTQIQWPAISGLNIAEVNALAVDPVNSALDVGTSSGLFYLSPLDGGTLALTDLSMTAVFGLANDPSADILDAAFGEAFLVDLEAFNNIGPGTTLADVVTESGSPDLSAAIDTANTIAYAGNEAGEILSTNYTSGIPNLQVENLISDRPGSIASIAVAPTTAGKPATVYAGPFEQFDAAVSELDPTLSTLKFSSYLGGTNSGTYGSYGQAIVVAPSGNVYIAGGTAAPDFGCAAGACASAGAFGALTGDNIGFVAALPNTPTGSDVTAEPNPTTSVTFSSVSSSGNTTATTTNAGPAIPGNLAFAEPGTPYENIATGAVISGAITVCINYNPATIPGGAANLLLLHYQLGAWVNVTTSNNTTTGIICGRVPSLSPFALVVGSDKNVAITINPPAHAPAPIQTGPHALLLVEIEGGRGFEASQINPATIALNGASVQTAGRHYLCLPIGNDMLCSLNASQFQSEPGSNVATLTATTFLKQDLQGQETFTLIKPHSK